MKRFHSSGDASLAALLLRYEKMTRTELIKELLNKKQFINHSSIGEPADTTTNTGRLLTKRQKHEKKVGTYGCRLIALRISYLGNKIYSRDN